MAKFDRLMFKYMKRIFFGFCIILFASVSFSQSVSQNLQKAWQQFESDSQLKHAISSLYVIDAKTGQVVFDKNSQIGLAPASTQKIITAATAFELLGKDYRYKTEFFKGPQQSIYVLGKGDPTFGSWRYKQTIDTNIFRSVINAFEKEGINSTSGLVIYDNENLKNIPSGWIFEDIGNYYGAAPQFLNWYENQIEITFKPGNKEGEVARIDTTALPNHWLWNILENNCKTGKKGSGDNAYVYFIPGTNKLVVEGTVPAGVDKFKISATNFNPAISFSSAFIEYAFLNWKYYGDTNLIAFSPLRWGLRRDDTAIMKNLIYTHYSPSLDSITYWFLKKSINLYGEALLKTFAYEKNGFGSTDGGVKIVKDFWKQKGIDGDELNISDGSGLSPQNRVTTHAQVEILKYAKSKDWFQYYLNGFPEYNGMTMKSGTIRDVKGFCGYHKAKDGKEYIFSFLVNNYNGRTSAVVSKMYKVLDELK